MELVGDLTYKMLKKMLLVWCLLLLPMLACGGITGTIDRNTDKAVQAIDFASARLIGESNNWEMVLQDVINQLRMEGNTAADKLDQILQRGIANSQAAVLCGADFFRDRLREVLAALKATLLGGTPVLQPHLCQANPSTVTLSEYGLPTYDHVELGGYNLSRASGLMLILNTASGAIDVTAAIDFPTPYLMTINLGSNGVQFGTDSQRLVISWQNQEIQSVGVIQPQARICETYSTSTDMHTVTFIPPHTYGDREYQGHGPMVELSTEVWIRGDGQGIDARIWMKAAETESDWTTAEGETVESIYAAPAGWHIKQMQVNPTDYYQFLDTNHDEDYISRPEGGPVYEYVVVGDTKGDDAGVRTRVNVKVNAINILLEESGNCTPS